MHTEDINMPESSSVGHNMDIQENLKEKERRKKHNKGKTGGMNNRKYVQEFQLKQGDKKRTNKNFDKR
jgi:hypothetical protein